MIKINEVQVLSLSIAIRGIVVLPNNENANRGW